MDKKARIDVRPTVFVLLLLMGAFLVVVPGSTLAAQDGDYTYTTSGSPTVANITDYTGAGGDIIIPSTLGGYPVLSIGAYAFANHTSLTSVTIPDSVTTVGNSAFQSCSSLTSITIPNGVTTIGKLSFWFCTALTSVSIPNSVTSIGFGAFDYCTAVTSLTIGSGVTTIGDYAFEQCTALTSVSIPDGVTSIGNMSFFACHMTSVTIGSGVTTIGGNVFNSCHSLTSITFLGLVAPTSVGVGWVNDVAVGSLGHAYAASNFPAPGGVWNGLTMGAVIPATEYYTYTVSNGNATITGYTGAGGAIAIPSTLGGYATVAIKNNAFYNTISLTSVTIPDSVTSIGGYAFYSCTSLTSVTIGSGVRAIGDWAFKYCTSLTSITFRGLVAPTAVGGNWVSDTNTGLRGHVYAASNFPAPGGVWNGLTMGAVIPVATVPGTPTNLTSTPDNAQVVLAWTAPVDDGGSAIIGYKLYRSTTSGGTYSLITSPTALTYTDTGLTNGQTYWYKVSAVNAIGAGVNCTAVSALVPQPVSPASDDSMLILVGVIAIAVVLVVVLLFMRRKKK